MTIPPTPLQLAARRRLRKKPEYRRKNMLTIRLSRDEYDLVQRAADLAGKSVNQWCREVLLSAAKRELERQP